MKNKHYILYILPYLLIFAIMGVVALSFPQKDLHLYLNQYHSALLDKVMLTLTYIAAYGIYVVTFGLLFWRWRTAVALLIAHLASTAITQAVKHIVRAPRPALVFDLTNYPDALPTVEGVKMHIYNSFPSGHTTTISTLCVFLTLLAFMYLFQNKHQGSNEKCKGSNEKCKGSNEKCKESNEKFQWSNRTKVCIFIAFYIALFLLCVGCGYSRVYLSQHFLLDVAVGGLIGTIVSCIVVALASQIEKNHSLFAESLKKS